jgi:hypothetical protein
MLGARGETTSAQIWLIAVKRFNSELHIDIQYIGLLCKSALGLVHLSDLFGRGWVRGHGHSRKRLIE